MERKIRNKIPTVRKTSDVTVNIAAFLANNRRFTAKICGPQKEVLAFLKSRPGVVYAEVLAQRDGDAYTYMIESEVGIDIRKNLFFALAEKKWALIGLEALGMSLEDIFITIVDQTGAKARYERKTKVTNQKKNATENEIAKKMIEKKSVAPDSNVEKKFSALFGDDEAENK